MAKNDEKIPPDGAPANPGKPDKDHDRQVHVLHVGEVESENFKVPEDASLQAIWDKAYIELKVERREGDGFQAVEGNGPNRTVIDLAPYLHISLAEAMRQGLVKTRHFEITIVTGGA